MDQRFESDYQTPKSLNQVSNNRNNNSGKLRFLTNLPENPDFEICNQETFPQLINNNNKQNQTHYSSVGEDCVIKICQSDGNDEFFPNPNPHQITIVSEDQRQDKKIKFIDNKLASSDLASPSDLASQISASDSARGHSLINPQIQSKSCQSITDPSLISTLSRNQSNQLIHSSHSIHSSGTEDEVSVSIFDNSTIPECPSLSSLSYQGKFSKCENFKGSSSYYEEEEGESDTCSCSGSTCTYCTCSDLCSLTSDHSSAPNNPHQHARADSNYNNNSRKLINNCPNYKCSDQEQEKENPSFLVSHLIPSHHFKINSEIRGDILHKRVESMIGSKKTGFVPTFVSSPSIPPTITSIPPTITSIPPTITSIPPTITSYREKTVSLHRGNRGFGFVLRGAKATSPAALKGGLVNPGGGNGHMLPGQSLIEPISLQYLDEIEEGGIAQAAGLAKGDFLLNVNGVDVRMAPHETVVKLIRAGGDKVTMSVATPVYMKLDPEEEAAENAKRKAAERKKAKMADRVASSASISGQQVGASGQEIMTNGGKVGIVGSESTSSMDGSFPPPGGSSDGSETGGRGRFLPPGGSSDGSETGGRGRSRAPPPAPPKRDPSTTLSVGRARARSLCVTTGPEGQNDKRRNSQESQHSQHSQGSVCKSTNGSGREQREESHYKRPSIQPIRIDRSSTHDHHGHQTSSHDHHGHQTSTDSNTATIRSRGTRRMSALELEEFFQRQEGVRSSPYVKNGSNCPTDKRNAMTMKKKERTECHESGMGRKTHSASNLVELLRLESIHQSATVKTIMDGKATFGLSRMGRSSQENLHWIIDKSNQETVTLKNGRIVAGHALDNGKVVTGHALENDRIVTGHALENGKIVTGHGSSVQSTDVNEHDRRSCSPRAPPPSHPPPPVPSAGQSVVKTVVKIDHRESDYANFDQLKNQPVKETTQAQSMSLSSFKPPLPDPEPSDLSPPSQTDSPQTHGMSNTPAQSLGQKGILKKSVKIVSGNSVPGNSVSGNSGTKASNTKPVSVYSRSESNEDSSVSMTLKITSSSAQKQPFIPDPDYSTSEDEATLKNETPSTSTFKATPDSQPVSSGHPSASIPSSVKVSSGHPSASIPSSVKVSSGHPSASIPSSVKQSTTDKESGRKSTKDSPSKARQRSASSDSTCSLPSPPPPLALEEDFDVSPKKTNQPPSGGQSQPISQSSAETDARNKVKAFAREFERRSSLTGSSASSTATDSPAGSLGPSAGKKLINNQLINYDSGDNNSSSGISSDVEPTPADQRSRDKNVSFDVEPTSADQRSRDKNMSDKTTADQRSRDKNVKSVISTSSNYSENRAAVVAAMNRKNISNTSTLPSSMSKSSAVHSSLVSSGPKTLPKPEGKRVSFEDTRTSSSESQSTSTGHLNAGQKSAPKTWSEISSAIKAAKGMSPSNSCTNVPSPKTSSTKSGQSRDSSNDRRSAPKDGLVNEVDVLAQLVPPPPEFAAPPPQLLAAHHQQQHQQQHPGTQSIDGAGQGKHKVQVQIKSDGQPVHIVQKPMVAKPASGQQPGQPSAGQTSHGSAGHINTIQINTNDGQQQHLSRIHALDMDGQVVCNQMPAGQQMVQSMSMGTGQQMVQSMSMGTNQQMTGNNSASARLGITLTQQQAAAYRLMTPQQQAQYTYHLQQQRQVQLNQQQFATLTRGCSSTGPRSGPMSMSMSSGQMSSGQMSSGQMSSGQMSSGHSHIHSDGQQMGQKLQSGQFVSASSQGYQQFATLSRAGQKAQQQQMGQSMNIGHGIMSTSLYNDYNRLSVHNRIQRQTANSSPVQVSGHQNQSGQMSTSTGIPSTGIPITSISLSQAGLSNQQLQSLTPLQRQQLLQRLHAQQQQQQLYVQQQQQQQLYVQQQLQTNFHQNGGQHSNTHPQNGGQHSNTHPQNGGQHPQHSNTHTQNGQHSSVHSHGKNHPAPAPPCVGMKHEPQFTGMKHEPQFTGMKHEPVNFPRKSMIEWSTDDVSDWLVSIGMSDYKSTLDRVNGSRLVRLNPTDLANYGIRSTQHNSYILDKVRQYLHYQQQHPPTATSQRDQREGKDQRDGKDQREGTVTITHI